MVALIFPLDSTNTFCVPVEIHFNRTTLTETYKYNATDLLSIFVLLLGKKKNLKYARLNLLSLERCN